MNPQNDRQLTGLDVSTLIWGLLLGMIIGGAVAMFRAPRSGQETRQQLAESGQALREKLTPVDPVTESLAEGKAAARRRRAELGLG